MATDNEHDDDTAPDDLPIDGGTPTDEEAKLAGELDQDGDDTAPDGEGEAKSEDEDKAEDQANDEDKGEHAEGDDDGEAAPEPAPAPAPEPAAAAANTPSADPKPEAPKDFDAEFTSLQQKFDDGDLDDAQYQQQMRAISREEADHTAKVAVWEDRQQRRTAEQEDAFNTAALAWQGQHAEFLANPLHVKSMNDALVMIAQQEPGLTADELVEKAGNATFDAFNYTPPTADDHANAREKVAKATAARTPAADKVPPSVRGAPAAAQIDPSKSSFSQLDDMDISDLEDAVARLPADKVEQFLADAPGAASRGS